MFSRRHVVAGALAVPFFPTSPATSYDAAQEIAECCASLARLFPSSLDAVRGLGLVCRECGDSSTARAALIDALCPDAQTRALVARGNDEEVRCWADAKIRADFAAGRVARLDGWVLAETEVRLYTLLADM